MARPLLTKNAVTNAVAANTPIAFCMTGISCVEWPDQTGPATYGLVRCLDVRIATRHRPAPAMSSRLSAQRLGYPLRLLRQLRQLEGRAAGRAAGPPRRLRPRADCATLAEVRCRGNPVTPAADLLRSSSARFTTWRTSWGISKTRL
jgi:hypothetical protein